MKNLLVYISPNKKFNPEHEKMVEVQIENSLNYWKPEDIVLFTNFPYKYGGIKAIVAPDIWETVSKTNPKAPRCVKLNAFIYMLENGLLNDVVWNHDFDAFQVAPLEVSLKKDLGLVSYGIYTPKMLHKIKGMKIIDNRINFGSIFFKPQAIDIFKYLLEMIDREEMYDEDGMTYMLHYNLMNVRSRIQMFGQEYNIGIRCFKTNLRIAKRPLRIFHFPPNKLRWRLKFRPFLRSKLRKLIDEKFTDLC